MSKKPKKATKALGEVIVSQIHIPSSSPVKVKDAVNTKVSICDKARELATQAEQALANEAVTREQAFLDSLFPDRSQYTNHGDRTYTICGWRWSYSSFMEYDRLSFTPFDPDNLWKGIRIFGSIRSASNLTSFGSILLDIDERLKDLPVQYPNTLWGFLKRLHRQWMEGL